MKRSSLTRFGLSLACVVSAAGGGIAACSSSSGDDSIATNDASTNDATQTDATQTDAAGDSNIIDAAKPEPTYKISIGYNDSCALTHAGSVVCWGDNGDGRLGRPTPTISPNFADATVPPINASVLGSGWYHACASGAAGLQCWGYNDDDQLGSVGGNGSVTPVSGISGTVNGIAATWFHTCALVDTDVFCWGDPEYGDLGFEPDGSSADPTPTKVPLPGAADKLVVALQAGCARMVSDGSIWCWGGNHMGELAIPYDGGYSATPLRVGAFTGVLDIAGGEGAFCAILSDRSVTCWGRNAGANDDSLGGGLGHDPATDQVCLYGACDPIPTAVPGITDAREISLGGGQTCIVKTDDTVSCWGENQHGQAGHDPATGKDGGGTIYDFTPSPVAGLSNVAHVSAGVYHTCALTRDDHVYCWGNNESGELGSYDGAASSFTPIEVPAL